MALAQQALPNQKHKVEPEPKQNGLTSEEPKEPSIRSRKNQRIRRKSWRHLAELAETVGMASARAEYDKLHGWNMRALETASMQAFLRVALDKTETD